MEPVVALIAVLFCIAILIALFLAPLKLYSMDGKLADVRDELAGLNAETRAVRLELVQQTELLQALSRNLVAGKERGET